MSSSISQNKEELLESINSSYKKLKDELNVFPDNLAWEKTMEWHVKWTKMSINDLFSYLIGRWELVLKRDRIYSNENRIPQLLDDWYGLNEWWKLAQKFYKDYEDKNFEELIFMFDEIVKKILKMIESKEDKDLYGKSWYTTKSSWKDYPFGRMIALNTSSSYKNARSRLIKLKKEKWIL